ncbi:MULTISPECIES: hypothetical protein [Oligella]|uniref:Uncharacterized protein n=1 Tax=Oligella urethralis TaxID=90245 RepID=A0A2X1VHS6_9BURK|nr:MULTISPECIES: hypothetical protein [Oligella]OFV49702.1 hypothetical protein HMPREF3179_03585 [Oligella sp. HMSC09E12]SPY08030.1 Uncharacterised protein [Oligella urethralis]
MLTDYTTHEDIRAVLGVEEDEINNSTIELDVFITGLESDLHELNPTLDSTFKVIKSKQPEDVTPLERRVVNLTKAFATYSVAKQLANALPMFAPRIISDGKSSLTRFSGEPFKEVIEGIDSQYKLARSRLLAVLDELQSESKIISTRSILFVSSPSYDPVTGE